MADNSNQKTLVDSLWDFLASVKLAVLTMTVISLTSIVGTVVEQNVEKAQNIKLLIKFVGESMAPQVYDFLNAMGFMDMYRSWWFMGLLMIFAVNLIICSIDRIPPAWRAATEKLKPLKDDQFGAFPVKGQVMIDGSAAENRSRIVAALKTAGFSSMQSEDVEGGYQLLGAKHSYSRMGVYVVHVSILVIMIGAIIGAVFGFKGYVSILEGDSSVLAYKPNAPSGPMVDKEQEMARNALLQNGGDIAMAAASFQVSPEAFKARLSDLGIEPFGFMVTCDDSNLLLYNKSWSPKEYSSDLSVYQASTQPVYQKHIVVNDPLHFNGYTFYQSNHGLWARVLNRSSTGVGFYAPNNPQSAKFIFRVTPPGGTMQEIAAMYDKPFMIPGTNAKAVVKSFIPSYGFQSDRQNQMLNMVVVLEIEDPVYGTYSHMTYKRADQWWPELISAARKPLQDGTFISVVDVWGIEYTGLQVRRDPGVWVVYLGCGIMSIGLFMAFFMSHRRLWVQATDSNGNKRTSLIVAGTAYKHREGFERRVNRALSLLSEGGKE